MSDEATMAVHRIKHCPDFGPAPNGMRGTAGPIEYEKRIQTNRWET